MSVTKAKPKLCRTRIQLAKKPTRELPPNFVLREGLGKLVFLNDLKIITMQVSDVSGSICERASEASPHSEVCRCTREINLWFRRNRLNLH